MSALLQTGQPDSRPDWDVVDPEFFERTVPRTLVHRSAVSEVLLTGVAPLGAERYRVGAQWARSHSFYGAVAGRWHDPMVFAETIRQVGLLLGHQALGIPLGFSFLTASTSFDISEKGARLADLPAQVVLDVSLRDIVRRRDRIREFAYDVTAYRGGSRIGSGSAGAVVTAPDVYRRLRGSRADARPTALPLRGMTPERVGRARDSDVVIADTPDGCVGTLRADGSHPVLFDHPVDHIPGMVLLEAARQAALAALRRPDGLFVACSAMFRKYVEWDVPCSVAVSAPTADGPGRRLLTVDFAQAGAVAGSCRVAIQDDPE